MAELGHHRIQQLVLLAVLCGVSVETAAIDPVRSLTGRTLKGHVERRLDRIENSTLKFLHNPVDYTMGLPEKLIADACAAPVRSYEGTLHGQVGQWYQLPPGLIQAAQEFYSVNLAGVRFAVNIRTSNGAAQTFGKVIYFPRRINFADRGDVQWMLHELEHVVQYANSKWGSNGKLCEYMVRLTQAAEEYLLYLQSHDGKDITSKQMRFREHLLPHLGLIQVDKFSDDHWLGYVDRRKKEGASPATINRERSALLHMFNTMRRRKQIQAVPLLARQREPAGKLTYLLPEESQRLVDAAKYDASPHALPFVMIGLFTGLRHSPILNLRAGDVDPARRILWIGKDKAGRREQPMPQVLADYLSELIRDLSPEQLLFGSSKSSTGRVHQMNTVFARCVERAGITKHVTPHTLRHTAATNAAHAGLDAATIQAMGGWKTRAMAERYTHAASMQDAMDALQRRLTGVRITRKLHTKVRELPAKPYRAYSSMVRAEDS